jgi:HD-GYP domain-containing protein (c-di-GMP phosphodiesterase class II)
MDELLRRNVPLLQIIKARPYLSSVLSFSKPGDEWENITQTLETTLRDASENKPWLEQFRDVLTRARTQAALRMDEALFHFIYEGQYYSDQYSSHQAMRCMLIASEVARCLSWDASLIDLLERSALTMNIAMRRLQNVLAQEQPRSLDAATYELIARHPADGAQLLQDRGVEEPNWIEAVRLHHDATLEQIPVEQRSPGQRVAVLLRRVDIYSAKLSRRAGRAPMTAMQAAREVCLGANSRPDRMGAALLKAMGLYPPGSFVQLESRELALVLARGGKQANQPRVAVLINAQGVPLPDPRLRDTAQSGYAVRTAISSNKLPLKLPPDRVHALQEALRTLQS